jgi:hypothetical protein
LKKMKSKFSNSLQKVCCLIMYSDHFNWNNTNIVLRFFSRGTHSSRQQKNDTIATTNSRYWDSSYTSCKTWRRITKRKDKNWSTKLSPVTEGLNMRFWNSEIY